MACSGNRRCGDATVPATCPPPCNSCQLSHNTVSFSRSADRFVGSNQLARRQTARQPRPAVLKTGRPAQQLILAPTLSERANRNKLRAPSFACHSVCTTSFFVGANHLVDESIAL